MKFSRETLTLVALIGVALACIYFWWDASRLREARYSCSDGPKEIVLTFAGIPFLESLPLWGKFSLEGSVTSGAAMVKGFPGSFAEEDTGIRFSAGRDRISREHNSEWYDAPVLVRFEPDSKEAICNFRIVYRMSGALG